MKLKKILSISLVMLCSFTTTNSSNVLLNKTENKSISELFNPTTKLDSESLTYRKLYEEILTKNIKYPKVVFAQAVIESGHFKSPLFTSKNNLFGMRVPKRRETTAINKGENGYAKYHSWDSSLEDYLLWQQFVLKNKNEITKSQYLSLLGRVYAENENYVQEIIKVINSHKKILEL